MKNFTKQNFKTNPLWIRLLIMTFMLLAGSGSAWAWTVYFDNSQTKWSNVYVVLGHDTYHRGDYKMTKVSNSDEIYYLTRDDWGDAKYITFSNSEIASGGSNNGFKTVITSGYDTFNNGASSLNHLFYSKVNNTISKNNDLYPRLVINCGLIGFYVGEYQDWGQSQFYVHSNGSGHISSYNTFDDGTTAKYGIIYAESKNYNVTHSTSWGGPTMGEKAILGKRYLITGDNSVSTEAGTILSCTFNIDKTIKAGETSTASVTSSGKSKYGTKNYAVDSYYIKKSGESTLTKLTISGNELQTQSLEVGTYTIYVLLYDGKIYAKGAEQTLTIETACITPDAPFEGIAQSETICKGSTYEFDSNYKWYTGLTGETTVSGSEEINSNTDYYIVNVAPEGCESARTKYTINVDEPLVAPTLIPTNPTTCNGNPTAGSIVIENYANYSNEISFALYKDENPTGITYNNGFAISEGGDYKVVMTTTASNVCGQRVETEPISIEIVDVTPTVTPFEITKQANVCMGNPVTLSYDGTARSGTISYAWYEGDSEVVIGTESTLTIQQAKNASYKLVVTVTSNDCPASDEATTTVEPKAVPSAPTFDNDAMDACVDQQFTLPTPNNLKNGEEALWTVEGKLTTASQTIDEAGEYRYIAYKNDGCPSEGTPFTVRVNPLPTINIGEDVTAVLYEDVELTATGENIDKVEWTADKGTITKDPTDPKKAVLTYDQIGTVTVTATATSAAGCTSVAATKTVTFGAEDCSDDVEYDNEHVEIWLSSTLNKTMYLHRWYENGDNDTNITTWPGASTTKSDGYYKWVTTSSGKIGYIFHDYTATNKSSDANRTMEKGYRYYFTFNGGTGSATFNKSERITTTTQKPITAPAAKTTLLKTTEGEGNINFNGQVVKTGCAETLTYGFAYSTDANADKNSWTKVESTNNGNTVGSTFSGSVNELQDGTYYVCAYITNSTGTAYGTVNEITVSNIKYPIENISLNYCNRDGEIIPDPNPMCKGTTAYIKLDYEGSRYSECKWLINGVATDRIQNFNNNVWVFDIQGDETVTVELRNDANKDGETPTWATSNKLTFTMVAEPTTPTVSVSPNVICSNKLDGATLSIASVAVGQTYVLYKYADENDNTGAEVGGYDALPCIDAKDELSFTNLTQAGRYFVKTYNTDNCQSIMTASSFATLEVVDASDVFIGFEPTSATTTPWMPAKFTVNASDKYTLTVPDGVVYNIDGNKVSVKIPLPEGSTGGDGQYENVSFPQDAVTGYTITANLATSGGDDNPCATPANATITLVPYEEECTVRP